MERRDIRSCIRSCEDRAMAIKNGETKYAWGKGQKKRAYELEMMKIKVLQDLLNGDLVPVVRAKWEDYSICSNCGKYSDQDVLAEIDEYFNPPYCPYCGAKMDLEG